MNFDDLCEMLEEKAREFSCVMAMIDTESETGRGIMEFVESIPDEHIYDEEGYGRETEPHVTILYGLHSANADRIAEGMSGIRPFVMQIESASFFEKDDYNVLKFDIRSDDLVRANEALKRMPHTDEFPEYHPHLTLAYLKKDVDKSLYEGATLDNSKRVDSVLVKISTPQGHKFMNVANRTEINEPLP